MTGFGSRSSQGVNWENETEVINQVKKDGMSLEKACTGLRGTKSVVLAAVKENGMSLQFSSLELKSNREIGLAAIKQTSKSIQFVSKSLKGDRELVLLAVKSDYNSCNYIEKGMLKEKDIILAAISNSGYALRFACFPLNDDRECVIKAVTNVGLALKYASMELRGDDEIVKCALSNDIKARKYASNVWKEMNSPEGTSMDGDESSESKSFKKSKSRKSKKSETNSLLTEDVVSSSDRKKSPTPNKQSIAVSPSHMERRKSNTSSSSSSSSSPVKTLSIKRRSTKNNNNNNNNNIPSLDKSSSKHRENGFNKAMEDEIYNRHYLKFMLEFSDEDPDIFNLNEEGIILKVKSELKAKEALAYDISLPYLVINSLLGTVLGFKEDILNNDSSAGGGMAADMSMLSDFKALSCVTLSAPPLVIEEGREDIPASMKWKLTSGGYIINQANNNLVLEVFDVKDTLKTNSSKKDKVEKEKGNHHDEKKKPKRASARANFKAFMMSEEQDKNDGKIPSISTMSTTKTSNMPTTPVSIKRSSVRVNLKVLLKSDIDNVEKSDIMDSSKIKVAMNDDTHQKWKLVDGQLISLLTGSCLTVRNGSKKINAEIWAREPNSSNAQWWYFK